MRFSSILVAVSGLAMAGGSVYAARGYLDAEEAQAVGAATVEVLVASRDIAFGAPIDSSMLAPIAWPSGAVPGRHLHRRRPPPARPGRGAAPRPPRHRARGAHPRRPRQRLRREGTITQSLGPNARAMAISVDAETAVGGFVTPGDFVDVVLTQGQADALRAVTILQNIRVIGVDQDASEQDDAPEVARTVTVEVSPDQGQRLALAQQAGKLSLSLRDLSGGVDPVLEPLNLVDLLQMPPPPAPVVEVAAPVVAEAVPAPVAPRRTVLVRRANVASVEERRGPAMRRTLRQDEDGAILVFVGVALAVRLGFVALSFDLGRMAATQTELQSFADSVALAAAAELDGKSDSITRATGAAGALIADRQRFGDGGPDPNASDFALAFLSSLPADEAAAGTATANPLNADYVRVDVAAHVVQMGFASALSVLRGGGAVTGSPAAGATAGFQQYACDVTPLMFCLSSPSFTADADIGRMVLLVAGGGGTSAWGPGDFGFLDPAAILADPAGPCAGLSGGPRERCLLAAVGASGISQCTPIRGVTTEPGIRTGIEAAAFNVRFDLYEATMSGMRGDAAYAPAPNVIKGYSSARTGGGGGGSCQVTTSASAPSMALPRDPCFAAGTCARFGLSTSWTGATRTGTGSYIAVNYGAAAADPHPAATTRWQYYRDEIARAGGASATTRILAAPRPETGRPQCNTAATTTAERRIVIAAGVDCTATVIRGRITNVPVQEFFRIFLTEPVDAPGGAMRIFGEIVGSAGGGGSGGAGGVTVGTVSATLACVVGTYRVSPAPVATVSAPVTITFPFAGLFALVGSDLDTSTTTVTDRSRVFGS